MTAAPHDTTTGPRAPRRRRAARVLAPLPTIQPPAKGFGGWLARDEAIMGTAIRVELWCEDARRGAAAIDAVMAEMHRIDHAMSPHKPGSELSRLNREAGEGPFDLSEEMAALIGRALDFSALTGGAFDISYAAAGRLYDYRACVCPNEQALAAAQAAIGWQYLEFDREACTLRFARPGMCIDLGGFAKGYAVDNASAILARFGIDHAMVSAGGDSRVIGDRRGRPWSVAIRDPRRADGIVAVLPLADCSISTSGDYERAFVRDGQRHHHLIDPATGRSPRGVRSVTVLSDEGLTCEALSKAVFVLGVERGLALVDHDGVLHRSLGLDEASRPDDCALPRHSAFRSLESE